MGATFDKMTITIDDQFLNQMYRAKLISTDATKTDVYYALLGLVEDHTKLSSESVSAASQERGTVETFRNRRNPNKYIEVKKGNDGHSYARQYLKWDTPNGEVKNYMGSRTSRGRYFRARRDSIDQMVGDYDPIQTSTLVEEFMKYHEDGDNYRNNEIGFDQMYEILDQYGDASEDVNVVFDRASEEDKQKMIDLIRPKNDAVLSSSEVDIVRSGYSFDFIHDGNYDEKAIREVIEDSFDRMALEFIGMDFESVDYSNYPDYADKHVSQCQVTFDSGEKRDYDGNAITDMIEQRLAQLGHEVIGNDFYSI